MELHAERESSRGFVEIRQTQRDTEEYDETYDGEEWSSRSDTRSTVTRSVTGHGEMRGLEVHASAAPGEPVSPSALVRPLR